MDLRVALVSNEYPGFGFSGGFGYVTKEIAEGLRDRGLEVFVFTTKHSKERNVRFLEDQDGILVFRFPKSKTSKYYFKKFYRMLDIDIFHHQDVNNDSFFSYIFNKDKKHIITFQDPAPFEEFLEIYRSNKGTYPSKLEAFLMKLKYDFYRKVFVKTVIFGADRLYSQVRDIIPFIKSYFNLDKDIGFLPNPVKIRKAKIKKSEEPTILFLGRFDSEKRPHLVVKLARKHRNIKFIMAGAPMRDKEYGAKVISLAKKEPNIYLPGWVSGNEKEKLLNYSWILINTSSKERLPLSFLEAMAHKMALIAYVNPDNLVSDYGFWAKDENFSEGIDYLINDDKWKDLGNAAYDFVLKNCEFNRVINRHIEIYQNLLKS